MMAGEAVPTASASRPDPGSELRNLLGQVGPVMLALGLIYVGFCLVSPPFRTFDTLLTVLTQATILAVLACGTTVVLISGGLDLSVGSIFAIVGVLAGQLIVTFSLPAWQVVILCLAAGTFCGWLNGMVQTVTKVPAFIVTLGGLTAYRGIAELLAAGKDLSRFPPEFRVLGTGYLVPISIMVAVAGISWYLLSRTRIGNYAYAIGGNEEVARLAGINVSRYRILYYSFGGLTAAVAALIQTSRLDFAQSSRGVGYELFAIAAVVIGGTSLFGGRGGIIRTVIGMMIIQTIAVGLSYLGVDTSTQRITIGIVIILAVWLDVARRRTA